MNETTTPSYVVEFTPRELQMAGDDWHAKIICPDGKELITTSRYKWWLKLMVKRMIHDHRCGKFEDKRRPETYRVFRDGWEKEVAPPRTEDRPKGFAPKSADSHLGFWLVYYHDLSGLLAFHADHELMARRYAEAHQMFVKFVDFGADIRRAIEVY